MSIPIITVATQPEHAANLIKSATERGWELHIIQPDTWRGFGTKLIETYNYLKVHPEIERFVFADAYDVVVLGSPEEFERQLRKWFFNVFSEEKENEGGTYMVFSAEKGCWPMPQFAPFFHQYEHGFNFLNSGVYFSESDYFIQMIQNFKPDFDYDDQLWASLLYLQNHNCYDDVNIDTNQILFNSHSFIKEGEYTYNNNRVQVLGNDPIFIHCNGSGGKFPKELIELI